MTNEENTYVHKGYIANELREMHAIGRGSGSPRAKLRKVLSKIETLTHHVEEDVWGETKPMDHVEVVEHDD